MSLDSVNNAAPMSAVIIGNESLLIQCATLWLDTGNTLAAVVTRAPDVRAWASEAGLRVISSDSDIAAELLGERFDWLLSVANLDMLSETLLKLPAKGAVNFHDGPLHATRASMRRSGRAWRKNPATVSRGTKWKLARTRVRLSPSACLTLGRRIMR